MQTKSNVKVGARFFLGHYPQTENGEEKPILWDVLDIQDGKALLVSTYGLDCKAYDEESEMTLWEISTLRKWLNSQFLDTAFTEQEKQCYITTTTVKPDPDVYDSKYEDETQDKIFVLSNSEVKCYFPSEESRVCIPTSYALPKGALVDDDEETEDGKPTCSWWLRTPSKLTRAFTSGVYGSGLLEDGFGFPVCCNEICIRPALWMQLERPEWADEQ